MECRSYGGTGIGLRESPNGFISEISRSTLPRDFYLAIPLDNAEPFVYETHSYNNNHKEEVLVQVYVQWPACPRIDEAGE